MIEEKYLMDINLKCNELRSKIVYTTISEKECNIFYLPTKQTSFIGYLKGYYEQFQKISNGIKESDKLRANCKNYLKIYKDSNGTILQVKSIKKGKVDCVHQAFYDGDTMYLFPFSDMGGFYPTYIYVSCYDGTFVKEEYMVEGKQIIHEQYKQQGKEVLFELVDYVIGGSHPIRTSESGVFSFDPFDYKRLSYYSWLEDKNKD